MTDTKGTKNTIIDIAIRMGEHNNQAIVDMVLKSFPEAKVAAVRRQIYSRRFALNQKINS